MAGGSLDADRPRLTRRILVVTLSILLGFLPSPATALWYYEVYESDSSTLGSTLPVTLPQFSIAASGQAAGISTTSTAQWPQSQKTYFAARAATTLTITTAGSYTFSLTTEGGGRLFLSDVSATATPIIKDATHHTSRQRTVAKTLAAGDYAMVAEYYIKTGTPIFKVEYTGPDTSNYLKTVGEIADSTTAAALNHGAVLTLYGDNPLYLLQGAAWSEPGFTCTDTEDGDISSSVDYTVPSRDIVQTHNVVYTCTDSAGYKVTATRVVEVESQLTMNFQGPQRLNLRPDDLYDTALYKACCQTDGTDLDVTEFGTVTAGTSGEYSITYYCSDPDSGISNTIVRTVTVDAPPDATLVGDESETAVKGTGYDDSGLTCQDVVDDILPFRKAIYVERLEIVEVKTNLGTGASAVSIIDGETSGICTNTATGITYAILDFGTLRTVDNVKVYDVPEGLKIDVSTTWPIQTSNPTMDSCTKGSAQSASSGWSTISCGTPVAGAYVRLYVDSGTMTLPEVQVYGYAAPLPPTKIKFTSSGRRRWDVVREYSIYDAVGGYPAYGLASSVLAGETPKDKIVYDPTYKRWKFYDASYNGVTTGYGLGYPGEAAWEDFTPPDAPENPKVSPRFYSDPDDACSWMFGYTSTAATDFTCANGKTSSSEQCSGYADDAADQLKYCPFEKPYMCQNPGSDGWINCYSDPTECETNGYGGNRVCPTLTDNTGMTDCFETDIGYSPDMTSTTQQSTVLECQELCKDTSDCMFFTWDLDTTCHLHTRSASKKTSSGSTIGPRSCVPRQVIVGEVESSTPGTQHVFYACTDSLGQTVATSRTVEVACEGPNPSGYYGGNKIVCDAALTVTGTDYATATTVKDCASACLADDECEAYAFLATATVVCQGYKTCDGTYYSDDSDRQVGYCSRKDNPPKVSLDPSPCCTNVGVEYEEADYACIDYEDPTAPDAHRHTDLKIDIPGVYTITYSCTDTSGQTTEDTRSVTVKSKCEVPSDVEAIHPDGPCEEGNDPIPFGGTCTLRCETGRVPSTNSITCTTPNDLTYTSSWSDPDWYCGDSPCTAPTVAYVATVEKDGATVSESCKSAIWQNSTFVVASGSYCTANCDTSGDTTYVASPTSLTCSRGTFTPTTYRCRIPAAKPEYVIAGTTYPTYVGITFGNGAARDCSFASWEVQAQYQVGEGQTALDWFEPDGCTNVGSAGRLVDMSCTAKNLEQGATYIFRVREVCTSTDLNSEWQTSQEATMKIVEAPEMVFAVPTTSVTEDPEQILVAYSVKIVPGVDWPTATIKIDRACPQSADTSWSMFSNNITETTLTEDYGAEIVGGRILIITPPDGYFKQGCDFNITLAQGTIQTEQEPAKPSEFYNFNFTYIDERPYLTTFFYSNKLTESVVAKLLWSELCYFNCTAYPFDLADCEDIRDASESPTAARRCENVTAPDYMSQMDLTTVLSFTLTGLYPGVKYNTECTAYKWDDGIKPWITNLETPDTLVNSLIFTTAADTDNTLTSLDVEIWADCEGADSQLSRSTSLTTSDLDSGLTVQMTDYTYTCFATGELTDGQTATIRVVASIKTSSEHAISSWTVDHGPTITFSYTKVGTTAETMSDSIEFKICPVAHETTPAAAKCETYTLSVKLVDITFTFSDVTVSIGDLTVERRLAEAPTLPSYGWSGPRSPVGAKQIADYEASPKVSLDCSQEKLRPGRWCDPRRLATTTKLTVTQGMKASVSITVSRESFDWSVVNLNLGSTSTGFELPGDYDTTEGAFKFEFWGMGTGLSLLLMWEGASFPLGVAVDFVPPSISVASQEVPICCPSADQTALTFHLTGVPDIAALSAQGITGGGYALPGTYLKLAVLKAGQSASTRNLCGGTTWRTVSAVKYWDEAYCTLSPAAKLNITALLMILQYGGSKVANENTIISGNLTYALPIFTGVESDVDGAVATSGIVDLGVSMSYLYLTGVKMPKVANIDLQGVTVAGYRAMFEKSNGDRINICDSISSVDTTELQCKPKKCIDVSGFGRFPDMRLLLGDLETAETLGSVVALPRPYILSFGPSTMWDTQYNQTMWFVGNHFGEVGCPDTTTSTYSLIGKSTGATILLGDQQAECEVTMQNNTYVECVVSDQLMFPRTRSTEDGYPYPIVSSDQSFTFYSAYGMEALNGETLSAQYPSEPSEELPALIVSVKLTKCDPGHRRIELTHPECEACPVGRYVTANDVEFPLQCVACAEGTYQDEEGSTACKACPTNTISRAGSQTITDCLCKPGYFSKYLNTSSGMTESGVACTACHSDDYTTSPTNDDDCGGDIPIAEVCDAHSEPTCINEGGLSFRLCKAYCPGGNAWPRAKPTFWLLENLEGTTTSVGTPYTPSFVRCDPLEACLQHNSCKKMYEAETCSDCIYGYYRDDTSNLCVACGDDQVLGMILMAGLVIIMSVGGLFGATTFIRVQADIQFKDLLIRAILKHFVEPIKKSSVVMGFSKRSDQRKTVTLHAFEVGKSFSFSKYGDLGAVFRVDDRNVIHLCGLMPDSPLQKKAQVGWKLVTVNGKRLDSRTEFEVQAAIRSAKFPLRLTFHAARKTQAQLEQESKGAGAKLDLADDRKMVIIMMGVINSFSQVSQLDFDWPPLFDAIAEILSNLSFNLNFFHPECSVDMDDVKKWCYYLSVPYCMLGPLTLAFICATFLTLGKEVRTRGVSFWTKFWLLRNAYGRVCCMAAIMLLPFHYDRLLVPFSCVARGSKTYVSEIPAIQCSFDDETYFFMLKVSGSLGFMVICFYAGLMTCLWKSFRWQFGSQSRSMIPFYVAMVEVSTFGQRGYVGEVRQRVASNVCAARVYDPDIKKMQEREMALAAVDRLGGRTRKAMHQFRQAKAGNSQEEDESGLEKIADRLAVIKAKRRFSEKQVWADKPDGNIISYGWVLIINLAWRQIATLMSLKLTKDTLVSIGAAMLMSIFAGNITLLILFAPYKSDRINKTEAILLSGLFAILWMAVLRNLLTSHVNANLYTDVLAKVSRSIEVMAVIIIVLIVVVPLQQGFLLATRFILLFQGPDSVLNSIYFSQRMNQVKEKAMAEKSKISDLLDPDDLMDEQDNGENLATQLALGLPVLDDALKHWADHGVGEENVDPYQQRRNLLRLGKSVQQALEARQRHIEISLNKEAEQEELKRLAKLEANFVAGQEKQAAGKAAKDEKKGKEHEEKAADQENAKEHHREPEKEKDKAKEEEVSKASEKGKEDAGKSKHHKAPAANPKALSSTIAKHGLVAKASAAAAFSASKAKTAAQDAAPSSSTSGSGGAAATPQTAAKSPTTGASQPSAATHTAAKSPTTGASQPSAATTAAKSPTTGASQPSAATHTAAKSPTTGASQPSAATTAAKSPTTGASQPSAAAAKARLDALRAARAAKS